MYNILIMSSSNQTISDVNNLLRQASKAIMCGPECQKNEKMTQLYQTYLDSKTNLINAPQQIEQSAKNYYMFAEGPQGYNDYLNTSLDEKSTAIVNLIQSQFDNNLKAGQSTLGMYNGISVNYNSVLDLYDKYHTENIELEKKYKNEATDIFTNDRKTYYANQDTNYKTMPTVGSPEDIAMKKSFLPQDNGPTGADFVPKDPNYKGLYSATPKLNDLDGTTMPRLDGQTFDGKTWSGRKMSIPTHRGG